MDFTRTASPEIFSLKRGIRVLGLVFGGLALTVGLPVRAEKSADLEPIRRMEQRYRAAKTLQTTFLERYTENGRTVRVESGVAYFRRPGKMRWEYEVPEKNLFIVDGKFAWFYVPADHTVTRVPAKQSADWRTPLALLAGEAKVSRVCARIEPATGERAESAANAIFKCVLRGEHEEKKPGGASGASRASTVGSGLEAPEAPQSESTQDVVLLEVVRDTGELVRILVREKGGVGVEFHFAKWLNDPIIAESLFHFAVPPGVAIVNGELPAASGAAE